jgi:serine/threonine protein kinase
MLHLDIKGQNIFLQAPSEEYPGWPRPVLADFDTTVVLESEESKREDQLKIARQTGTFGWLPPVSRALFHSEFADKLQGA